MKKTRYYLRKHRTDTVRTDLGLVAHRSARRTDRPADLRKENYRACEPEAFLAEWFPGKAPDDPKKVVLITAHDDDLLSFCGAMSILAADHEAEIHHIILTDGSMGFGEAAMGGQPADSGGSGADSLSAAGAGLVRPADPQTDPGFFVRGDEADLSAYAARLRQAGEETARIRRAEAREAEKVLGFHATYFLDYPDAALTHYNFALQHGCDYLGATALALRLVRDIAPDLMILQDRTQQIDLNPDHYAAGWIGYTVYWHLHCPVLGVDPLDHQVKAVIQRGFEGVGRPEFRLPDYLVHLDDQALERKFDSLRAYRNQQELVADLFNTDEKEKWRIEAFFDADAPPVEF